MLLGIIRFPIAEEIDGDGFIKKELESGQCGYLEYCHAGLTDTGMGKPFSCRHAQAALGSGTWRNRRRSGILHKVCVYPLIANKEAEKGISTYQLHLPGIGVTLNAGDHKN